MLLHSINDDRCTGCDACVTVCPTDVLGLVNNKSRVQRFSDCIQCEQCAMVCPTTALIMHLKGTEPPAFRMPSLDEHYQADAGLYLIGEASGKPLVKNASNLGRMVVEHAKREHVRQPAPGGTDVDMFIVGSGPGGLSAALSCAAHGMSFVLVEKDELVASTIARYPKGKHVMAEPYDVRCVGLLPIWDDTKEQVVATWNNILDQRGIKVKTRETVDEVKRGSSGRFEITTDKGRYRATTVVLAIGTRGKPRRLGIPGEDLPKVTALLKDPDDHVGQRVIVVGGGDSAVEAAVALTATARGVTLSYRGKALSRCKAKNRAELQEQVEAGKITLLFGSNLKEIRPTTAMVQIGNDVKEMPNDHVIICIGGDAPLRWLERVGVKFVDQPHLFQRGQTDQVVEALIGPQPETTRESALGLHAEEQQSYDNSDQSYDSQDQSYDSGEQSYDSAEQSYDSDPQPYMEQNGRSHTVVFDYEQFDAAPTVAIQVGTGFKLPYVKGRSREA
jgi:putative YpdA family bacillithiol system oxidoreductase